MNANLLCYLVGITLVVVLFFAGLARGRELRQRRCSYHHALLRHQCQSKFRLDDAAFSRRGA